MVEIAELEEQRMQDHGSRLLGIDGMVVLGVVDVGHALELEVETIARAACCRWCGRASLTVKERPVVRVCELPLGGSPDGAVLAQAPLSL